MHLIYLLKNIKYKYFYQNIFFPFAYTTGSKKKKLMTQTYKMTKYDFFFFLSLIF